MPPKLPRVSGKEAVKALKRLGFEVVRQQGSHVVLKKGSRGCVVPLHRELQVGTLYNALRQAGVAPQEFIERL